MYEIRPESIKTYITDRTIRLPRFQRKQTWDDKKNFQLCISIFKNYPMGVCILSLEEEKGKVVRELLDGRQRRNALMSMYENPENIYNWARKFLGFKNNAQPQDIQEIFYDKINEYLEADDESDKSGVAESADADDVENDGDVSEEDSSDSLDSIDGLELLLYIITLVHNNYNHGTGFSRPFDFSKYVDKLPYIENVATAKKYEMNGKGLKTFINEYHNYCDINDVEYDEQKSFIAYIKSRCEVKKDMDNAFELLVKQNWEKVIARINLVDRIEGILGSSKIGLIEVKNIAPADSQKIFNIINSEGVKLTAAEILSAKPHWNKLIKNPVSEALEATKILYKNMGMSQNDVVRWDIPATLLGRLGNNVIYKNLSWDSKNQKAEFEKKLTLGFKTLSGIYKKGVKKEDIEKLGMDKSIDWETGVEVVISDLKTVIKLVEDIPYFKFLKSWKATLMELTSDTIAMNFLLLAYFDWKRKGCPIGSNTQTKQFQKNCFILWDKLIYEYIFRQWRGSSDSIVANNLASIDHAPALYVPISEDKWKAALKEIADKAQINNADVTVALMKPVLYHMYCMKEISAPDSKYAIEVDHIIPQALFKTSLIERKEILQDSLYNLGLLPKDENVSKSDKKLSSIDNSWLKEQVAKYESVSTDKEIADFSNINNYDKLFKKRKKLFDEVYSSCRNNLINN